MTLVETCKEIEKNPGIDAWRLWQETDLVEGHPWAAVLTKPSQTQGQLVTYYPALYGLAQRERPKVILEIGTGFGLSTASWILGNPDLEVLITLDLGIFGTQYGEKWNIDNVAFAQAKCESLVKRIDSKAKLHFIRCNTQPQGSDNTDVPVNVPNWREVPELLQLLDKYQVDLLFVDGKHTGDGCINDLHSFAPFVRPGGVILCDDLHEAGVGERPGSAPFEWAGQAVLGFRTFLAENKDTISESLIWQWPAVLDYTLTAPAPRPFGLIRYHGGIDREGYKQSAADCLARGDINGILANLTKARPFATQSQLYCDLGVLFAKKNFPDQAINTFLVALQKDENNCDALHNLALMYAMKQDFAKAMEAARSLELKSNGEWLLVDRIRELQQNAKAIPPQPPAGKPIVYPVHVKRALPNMQPVVYEKTETFDTPEAQAINKARMEHLLSLGLPLRGLRVLDLGGGVGHLAQWLLTAGARVFTTDVRAENIARAKVLYPTLRSEVADVERDELTKLGEFDAVFAYGLLYHLENPFLALRKIAALHPKLVMLETIISDSALPMLGLAEETGTYSQAVAGVAVRPSPAWIAMALNRVGFAHVYGAALPPDHIDYKFEWKNDGAHNRDRHNLRCVFVAAQEPLALNTLVPLLHD
ncbi:MAG: class I SAM-dependent methyltransferase [bacterium]|nr:class I SAM-dependent methyltransferase [bacterium]